MCIYSKHIRNPYTGKVVLVPCGKCEACRQRKANARARRIRNHDVAGELALFVTLTYRNDALPVVLRDDLLSSISERGFVSVPVYRKCNARLFHNGVKRHILNTPIDNFSFDVNDPSFFVRGVKDVHHPTRMSKKYIGVIYYKDVQDFFKRLRINLHRKYNYHEQISYFACAEYGPTTDRPHFHLLIFCKTSSYEKVQSAIIESWSFGDKDRTEKYIQIAEDASSYVASYVNSDNSSSKIFEKSPFSQTHSYSKGFGCRLECFSLAQILIRSERGALTYRIKTKRDGKDDFPTLPIPKYVINRYFPKFKGYSVVTDDEIRKLLLSPELLAQLVKSRNLLMSWTVDDIHHFKVRLNHLCTYFCDSLGWSPDEFWANYADCYVRVWNCWNSTILRMSYNGIFVLDDYLELYENIADCFDWYHGGDCIRRCSVHSDLSDLVSPTIRHWNWNARADVVKTHHSLVETYRMKDKTRKVVNHCLANSGHFV